MEWSDAGTWFRKVDFGTSDPMFPQSASPSVEVYGGISGEGAAICAIQASEAAYGFYGTRISG